MRNKLIVLFFLLTMPLVSSAHTAQTPTAPSQHFSRSPAKPLSTKHTLSVTTNSAKKKRKVMKKKKKLLPKLTVIKKVALAAAKPKAGAKPTVNLAKSETKQSVKAPTKTPAAKKAIQAQPATAVAKPAKASTSDSPEIPTSDQAWYNINWHWGWGSDNEAEADAPAKPVSSICDLVAAHPDWYRAAKATEQRWGVPVNVQFAIMHTESHFRAAAKNPHSTALGFAQAINGTWRLYEKDEGTGNRTHFRDASNFIGWYANSAEDDLGITGDDAYHLYLAYHDGSAAYKRQQKRGHFKIAKLAHVVQHDADRYAEDLAQCTMV